MYETLIVAFVVHATSVNSISLKIHFPNVSKMELVETKVHVPLIEK